VSRWTRTAAIVSAWVFPVLVSSHQSREIPYGGETPTQTATRIMNEQYAVAPVAAHNQGRWSRPQMRSREGCINGGISGAGPISFADRTYATV
jgi:hypothetical protein